MLTIKNTKLFVAMTALAVFGFSACSSVPKSESPSGHRYFSQGEDFIPFKQKTGVVQPDGRIYFVGEYTGCVAPDLCKKAAVASATDSAAFNIYAKIRSLLELATTEDADGGVSDVQREIQSGTLQVAKAEIHGISTEKFYHRLYRTRDGQVNRDEFALISLSKHDYDQAISFTLAKLQKTVVENPDAKRLVEKMEKMWLKSQNDKFVQPVSNAGSPQKPEKAQ